VLADGTYDVVVIDAEPGDGADGAVRVELTVLGGPHKGEVLALSTAALDRDPLDLLAVPGTLLVAGGEPHLTLEG
jgi:hypothetical protein